MPATAISKPTRRTQVPIAPDLSIGDLADRLQEARPEDTCKGMFFKGVLSAAKALMGEEGESRVQAMLPEKKYVEFFNYPIATFLPATFSAAKMLQPVCGGDFDAAIRRLGEQAITDFLATAVGWTLVSVSSGDIKRMMRAAPTAYRTIVSYGARETTLTSETSCDFKMQRDFMPHAYHEGALTAVLRAIGAKELVVRGEKTGKLDATYHISWK